MLLGEDASTCNPALKDEIMEQAIDWRHSCSRIPARPAPSRHELGSVGNEASLASKAARTCWSPKKCCLTKPMLCQLHRCFALLSRSYVASGGSRLSLACTTAYASANSFARVLASMGLRTSPCSRLWKAERGGATFRIHAPSSLLGRDATSSRSCGPP